MTPILWHLHCHLHSLDVYDLQAPTQCLKLDDSILFISHRCSLNAGTSEEQAGQGCYGSAIVNLIFSCLRV